MRTLSHISHANIINKRVMIITGLWLHLYQHKNNQLVVWHLAHNKHNDYFKTKNTTSLQYNSLYHFLFIQITKCRSCGSPATRNIITFLTSMSSIEKELINTGLYSHLSRHGNNQLICTTGVTFKTKNHYDGPHQDYYATIMWFPISQITKISRCGNEKGDHAFYVVISMSSAREGSDHAPGLWLLLSPHRSNRPVDLTLARAGRGLRWC